MEVSRGKSEIWTGPRSEIPNGCEVGATNGVFVGNFQSDPVSLMWWDVWLEIPMGLSLVMGSGSCLGVFSEWTPAQ